MMYPHVPLFFQMQISLSKFHSSLKEIRFSENAGMYPFLSVEFFLSQKFILSFSFQKRGVHPYMRILLSE